MIETKEYDIEILPLEALSDEAKKAYLRKGYWNLVEAIYLRNGYQPPEIFEFGVTYAKHHFPKETNFVIECIGNGIICKKIAMAGEIHYSDSIENWQHFWKNSLHRNLS